MNSASVTSIGVSLGNVAGVIAERYRQQGQGGKPPFPFVAECIDREVKNLRGDGHTQLADALTALGAEIEAMDNG